MDVVFPRTFVAGHRGLVGSAIVRALNARGCQPDTRSREEVDLTDARAVRDLFERERFEAVYLAAARVGGIVANDTYRWEFLYDNLLIETSVLGAALETGVERVIFFGSSCIYPRLAPQPISEDALLTGPLEHTNEPYSLAKIAGVKLVEAANARYGRKWLSLMPTNLYGRGDNFDLQSSHVLPAMIRKFHEAKTATHPRDRRAVLWGTGTVRREFLYVEDLADAALFLGGSAIEGLINVGFGSDLTVGELAALVADVVGFDGEVEWDTSKPDGTPRKLLDSTKLFSTGWRPTTDLRTGVQLTYDWYLQSLGERAPVREALSRPQ